MIFWAEIQNCSTLFGETLKIKKDINTARTYFIRRAIRLDAGQRGSLCPPFSMSAVRTPVFIGLLLLILTTGFCRPRDRDDTSLLDLLKDRERLAQEHQSEGNTQHPLEIVEHSAETKGVIKVTKSYQHERILEVFPRDLRQKEKFLKHLTGPLYFSPKCSKHFYKLYHNTRDCTIPAYYKRCARLLTRLAGSQRCSEG
uniref:ALK and LTK ligand 2b n=1 Tax=Cyprinus carpio TaxID=7962 RepID=A0A8C2GTV8_CYPCA